MCGRILCEFELCKFEIVRFKALMKSHFMRKVWNPKNLGKDHACVSKLVLNYTSSELCEVFRNTSLASNATALYTAVWRNKCLPCSDQTYCACADEQELEWVSSWVTLKVSIHKAIGWNLRWDTGCHDWGLFLVLSQFLQENSGPLPRLDH
jgi:hypothetical protein